MVSVAIIGATGLVGRTFLKVLEERNLKIDNFVLFASKNSANQEINFMNKKYIVQELNDNSFSKNKFNYALFSAGSDISKKYSPLAKNSGCIVIDNSSVWRMDNKVPLVVPEVNESDIYLNDGIIANPNCSTIQAVVALSPLNKKYKIKRVVISTYQAVSGAGKKGIDDFYATQKGEKNSKFPYPIYNNCIPQIDIFENNGYTKEEMKMINETRKILHEPNLDITATAVRVPVLNCHSESINIEFENRFEIKDVIKLLENSPGIKVVDNIDSNEYPINTIVDNTDLVYVGRIRRDYSIKNGLNLWIVADNIRKGAATNALQILEKLIDKSK